MCRQNEEEINIAVLIHQAVFKWMFANVCPIRNEWLQGYATATANTAT